MLGVAREQRYPERAWRGATSTHLAELRAWMLARHSRRHSDELEHWIGAIAEWRPPPSLSHHKLRWFRSVLLRYGPPARRLDQPNTPDGIYRKLIRAMRSARVRRQNERKRKPAPPRTSHSHPSSDTAIATVAGSSQRTSSRAPSSSNSTEAQPTPPREKESTPPH